MRKEFVLLGGGGLAIELLDYMIAEGKKPTGYYAPMEDSFLHGILPWLGSETEASERRFEYIIASGMVNIRVKIIEFLIMNGLEIGSFISNKSYISSFAEIGKGAVIAPSTLISGNPKIGGFFFLNAQSSVGHHAIVGDNVVVGPGVHITGHCKVGNNVSFGSNSSLIPHTRIGNNSEIAIGTFPKKKVADNRIVISASGVALER